MKRFVCSLMSLFALTASAEEAKSPPLVYPVPADILAGLDKSHPRLFLKDAELVRLKKLAETDAVLQRYVKDSLADAGRQLAKKPLEHVIPDGLRLLATSRDCLQRTVALGFAWRWTGERKYADAGIANLLAVCAFPDWNSKRHLLDTAELSNAVGIGYDWFYAAMDEKTRATVKAGLITHGLSTDPRWGIKAENNWNMVCNGGLIVGALAIAETDPEHARTIIPRALKYLPIAMKSYAPDGAWMEGPGYWDYATRYTVFMMAAMESSLGHSFGIDKTPGLRTTAYFPISAVGPSGQFLNFADAGAQFNPQEPGKPRVGGPSICLFWLAQKYATPEVSAAARKALESRPAEPFHVVWYQPAAANGKAALDRFFDGPVPIYLMRSSWEDPLALWCGVKAGFNQVPHGHLDLGNFEFETDGIRWALDLGSDNYNLPGYFGKQRWDYYRLKSESHNVPLIAGKGQLVDGVAKVLSTRGGEDPAIELDLSSAYRDRAVSVLRRVGLCDHRSRLRVEDRFVLKAAAPILWGMTTDAEIELRADGSARLSRKGRQIEARILSPAGAKFTSSPAEQKAPENPNKGIRRLELGIPAQAGESRVEIEFATARNP
ncbi:MAG: hypothetical protein RL095_4190 [Verrucomicrobiota bacterium]